MLFFRKPSIRRKLTFVTLCTSVLGLSLACLGFEVYERASFRAGMTSELSVLADTLGANTAASLAFNDPKSARDILSAVRAEPHVIAACLYDSHGEVFAEYRRAGVSSAFVTPAFQADGARYARDSLTLYRSVSLGGENVGRITIISDLEALRAKTRQYREISALVLLISIFTTLIVSSWFLRLITEPILQLAAIAGQVSVHEDYSLRATSRANDEIGTLVRSFNQMLERIQERDSALQGAKDQLERRVQERTEELQNEVNERKQAEAKMRRARDAAEQANRAKSEFLANMSHEIRTPLNGVMGMTDLALETKLTTEQREYLETAKMSADSLLMVINDVLDFSKIEAGKIELEEIDFNLRDSLESTLKTLALRADEKGLELLCEVAPDVPEIVQGDATRLRQVVVNLVGNAIKFTASGEVALRVQVETPTARDCVLHFTVADTGIGIPDEKRELIFEPFSQADTSTTRKYGGSGLGLTISMRFVEMMGGKIWVDSEVGRGSQFHFTARLKSADAKPIELGTIDPPEILRGVKVLIVDDNRTNRRILEGMLRRWEMKPTSVEGGEQALAQLWTARTAEDPFALILTDMHMPMMDGFAFVEQIRQRPELSTATIMMLTSAGHGEDAARCQDLGVAACLLKPIRQSELRDAIAQALGDGRQRSAIARITRSSLHDSSDPTTSLLVLLAEDNPVNQRVVVRLLEKRGHQVVVATNGLEALKAMEKHSFDVVLMDVQMPEMDGLEATAAIRKKERVSGSHIPVIALTAHAMKGDREKCLESGMDGYLTKPIQPQELDELLETCVTRQTEVRNGSDTIKSNI
jgi:signal transduction histidine kinase/CheY-like chemotaxis protein